MKTYPTCYVVMNEETGRPHWSRVFTDRKTAELSMGAVSMFTPKGKEPLALYVWPFQLIEDDFSTMMAHA